MRSFRTGLRAAAVLVVALGTGLAAPAAGAAPATALIEGSGSSWAANYLDQTIADVNPDGLQVVYIANGSAAGRRDFANGIVDVAVSDLPYQGVDPVTGYDDTPGSRAFRYAPLIGGGVALPFHLTVGGRPLDRLRLSGATIASLFTNRIRYWDDPAITADNNGRLRLPHEPVRVVVHSEGSAATFQLTDWLAHEYPALWPGGTGTPYFPAPTGDQTAAGTSGGVVGTVYAASCEGCIGYAEYSYVAAAGTDPPVAQVRNRAGWYVPPTQYGVAVALDAASTDATTGAVDLGPARTSSDPRAYPLSYATYALVPTGVGDPRMVTARRQTLAEFLHRALCDEQRHAAPLGYAPLPLPLVRDGIASIAALGAADPNVDLTGLDLSSCDNPTFTAGTTPVDRLGNLAPAPPACEQAGHGPCGLPPDPSALTSPAGGTLRYGGRRLLASVLRDRADGLPLPRRTVLLQARPAGTTSWRTVASLATDAGGRATCSVAPRVSTAYRFRFAGDADHAAVTGPAATSTVSRAVSTHLTAPQQRHRSLYGVVAPAHAGSAVRLQQLRHHRWVTVATGHEALRRLPDGRTVVGYRFGLGVLRPGLHTLRVVAGATATNAGGVSVSRTVRL